MLARIRQTASRAFIIPSRRFASPTVPLDVMGMIEIIEPFSSDRGAKKLVSPKSSTTSSPPQPIHIPIPPAEDPLLHYVTSSIMHHGHRHRAERMTSLLLMHLHTLTRAPPLPILRKAIQLASPSVRSVNTRKARKVIARPSALTEKQRTRYAMQWILQHSANAPGRTLEERIAREMIAIIKGDSEVLKAKGRVHAAAMLNRGALRSR